MAQFHVREYLESQSQQRYRACIIHADPKKRKTWFAKRIVRVLSQEIGILYFDLQKHFVENPNLASTITTFKPTDLKDLLLDLECEELYIIVDNVDFLLITWPEQRKRQFVDLIDKRIESPAETDKVFIFIVQTDNSLTSKLLENTEGFPRIIHRDSFFSI